MSHTITGRSIADGASNMSFTESKSLYMQPFDDSEVKSICLVSIKITTVMNSFCLSYAIKVIGRVQHL